MRILIAEDEPVIAQRIERLTKEILGDRIISIKNCSSIRECKSYLYIHQIDLLFLDLNLNGEDGYDLLKDTQADSFYTIIISAYGERAVKAFDFPVIDFIKKPFNKVRLEKAFDKLNEFKTKHNFTSKFLSIKHSSEIKLIEINSILYIKGAGVYSEIFTNKKTHELHHQNLEKINVFLPSGFVRIHKSYIVNMFFVDKIISHGGSKYSVNLKDGTELPVSRSRYQNLKEILAVR